MILRGGLDRGSDIFQRHDLLLTYQWLTFAARLIQSRSVTTGRICCEPEKPTSPLPSCCSKLRVVPAMGNPASVL